MAAQRTKPDRRRMPGSAIDVMRVEHENLYGQVEEILRAVRRLESDFIAQRQRIERMEEDLEGLVRRQQKLA